MESMVRKVEWQAPPQATSYSVQATASLGHSLLRLFICCCYCDIKVLLFPHQVWHVGRLSECQRCFAHFDSNKFVTWLLADSQEAIDQSDPFVFPAISPRRPFLSHYLWQKLNLLWCILMSPKCMLRSRWKCRVSSGKKKQNKNTSDLNRFHFIVFCWHLLTRVLKMICPSKTSIWVRAKLHLETSCASKDRHCYNCQVDILPTCFCGLDLFQSV